jgi:predicted RecB family endonuclease
MRPVAVLLFSFGVTALAAAQNPVPSFAVRMGPMTQPLDTAQRSACEAARAGLRSLGVQVIDTLSDYVREFIVPLESRMVMDMPDRLNQAIRHQVEEIVRPLTKR